MGDAGTEADDVDGNGSFAVGTCASDVGQDAGFLDNADSRGAVGHEHDHTRDIGRVAFRVAEFNSVDKGRVHVGATTG